MAKPESAGRLSSRLACKEPRRFSFLKGGGGPPRDAVADCCPAGAFSVTAGKDKVRVWDPGDGWLKAFCVECGSHTRTISPDPTLVAIRLGSHDPGIRPQAHQFVAYASPLEPLPARPAVYATRVNRSPGRSTPGAAPAPANKPDGSNRLSGRAKIASEIFFFLSAIAGLVKVFVTSWPTIAKGVFSLSLIGILVGIIWLLHQWNDDPPNPVGKATLAAAGLLAVSAALLTGEVVFQSVDRQPLTTADLSPARGAGPGRMLITGPCVSQHQAEAMIGLLLRQIDDERCGFVGGKATEPLPATCPRAWVCIWWEESGRVTLRWGDGQQEVVRRAALRYVPAYRRDDEVRDVCEFLLVVRRKEDPLVEYVPSRGQPSCP